MIDDDQDAMSQSHNGLLVPHALAQSLVIGPQQGAFTACSSVGGFNEGLAQPAVSFARFGAQSFVGTDLGGWTQANPGGEMSFIRKPIHLQSQFGHDTLAATYLDPCSLIEDANCLCAAQVRVRFRCHGKRRAALGRLTVTGCLAPLFLSGKVASWVRRVRILGTALHSQAMSNLLISLPYVLVKAVQLSQLTRQ